MKQLLFVLLLAGAGCGTGDDGLRSETIPTWSAPVHLILRGNCVRCHDDPARNGAPSYFRLDRYDESAGIDGRTQQGAAAMADDIVERAVLEGDMPPEGPPLTERQKNILLRWAAGGAPR